MSFLINSESICLICSESLLYIFVDIVWLVFKTFCSRFGMHRFYRHTSLGCAEVDDSKWKVVDFKNYIAFCHAISVTTYCCIRHLGHESLDHKQRIRWMAGCVRFLRRYHCDPDNMWNPDAYGFCTTR